MNVISLLHYTLIVTVIAFPLLENRALYLVYHLLFAITIIIQWRLNGECLLTSLEKYIYPQNYDPEEKASFTANFLRRLGLVRLAEFTDFTELVLLGVMTLALVKTGVKLES